MHELTIICRVYYVGVRYDWDPYSVPGGALPPHWRHNERDCVSNHQRLDCLLNRMFRRISNKIPKLRVTGLCDGNPPVTGAFPSQRPVTLNFFSIWYHHDYFCRHIVCRYLITFIRRSDYHKVIYDDIYKCDLLINDFKCVGFDFQTTVFK